jgi:formylglycine-generating enzyme required for sulfatase activity
VGDVEEQRPEADPQVGIIAAELLSGMVLFQGGRFTMGMQEGQDDAVLHEVLVSALNFGKYEVTQRQWEAVMGYNRSVNQGCPDCPVENVSWAEVDSFITRLNTAGKKKFRLPTEAEWEYVAGRFVSAGLNASPQQVFKSKWKTFLDRSAWHNGNAKQATHPIGRKEASAGVYDLLGNVAEWCYDYYRPDYQNDRSSNPKGPATGQKRVVKGGSYADDEEHLRAGLRSSKAPSERGPAIGFRLVTEVY